MRKKLAIAVLIVGAMIAPGLVPQARADAWLSIGTGFHIGPAHISLVFGQPFARFARGYYYRYDRPIAYAGVHCTDRCFRQGGYYYHADSCPVVRAHFRRYNVDPYSTFSRYAPRVDGYDGYDSYGYDDTYAYEAPYDGYDTYPAYPVYPAPRYYYPAYPSYSIGLYYSNRGHYRGHYDNHRSYGHYNYNRSYGHYNGGHGNYGHGNGGSYGRGGHSGGSHGGSQGHGGNGGHRGGGHGRH